VPAAGDPSGVGRAASVSAVLRWPAVAAIAAISAVPEGIFAGAPPPRFHHASQHVHGGGQGGSIAASSRLTRSLTSASCHVLKAQAQGFHLRQIHFPPRRLRWPIDSGQTLDYQSSTA